MRFIKDYIARVKDPKNPTARLSLISFALIVAFALILGNFVSYYLASQIQKYGVNASRSDIISSIITGWLIIMFFVLVGGLVMHFTLNRTIKRSHQQNMILQYELVEYSKELETNIHTVNDIQHAAILGLSKLAEYRDKETGLHLIRMSLYSKILAEELSSWDKYKFYITKEYIESIYTSSVLHDIGKVGIPDRVLLKPGQFTDEEWAIMQTHTTIGGDALKAASEELGYESFLTMGKDVAYFHHENFDGKGYPNGVTGDEIPLSARIVAFADAYDAITSKRVYKEAQGYEEAKDMLRKSSGKRYDPDMFDAFLNIEDKFIEIAEEHKEQA